MTAVDRVDARVERAARIVTIAATLWFALALGWGLFARVGGGHDAQIATRAIIAENMRAWHILAPVKDYTLEAPTRDQYYVHHPWGEFWVVAAFARVLGRGTWVPRLVGVLLSIATPPLLYGVARALWGPVAGALSALAYVVLPISLAFGNLPGFEVPVNFSVLLVTWGYLRFEERWRRRWMLVSLAGVVAATNSDWQCAVFLGVSLGALAAGWLLLPRWFGRIPLRPFMQWWVLAAGITALTVFGYFAYFQSIGALENLIHSETQRARGSHAPLLAVLWRRRYWIDVTFTPLAVTIGKIALPIFVARVLVWRKLNETFPLAILVMAVAQYVGFKNGADVHIYWPLPFAPYWALSLGVLGATAIDVSRWVLRRRGRDDKNPIVGMAALAGTGLIAILVLPDGIEGLRYAKATAGRFNEKGARIFDDVDMAQAMEWMAARMRPHTVVEMPHALCSREYRAQEWELQRPIKEVKSVPYLGGPPEERYYVGDLRFLGADDQRRVVSGFHVTAVGPYVLVDRQAPHAPLDAYSFDAREPNWIEWYLTNPTEPVRTIRPDPWRTWELREHFQQTPNAPPPGAPSTLDQVRIAHNIAVTTGDAAAAEHWKARILGAMDTTVATSFRDGTRLLGERFVPGVDPKLELYFLAAGPLHDEFLFEVASVIESRRWLSLVPPDDKIKKYGAPFVVSPRLWHKGFIYLDVVDIRHRPGKECFAGYFDNQKGMEGAPPKPVAGGEVPLIAIK